MDLLEDKVIGQDYGWDDHSRYKMLYVFRKREDKDSVIFDAICSKTPLAAKSVIDHLDNTSIDQIISMVYVFLVSNFENLFNCLISGFNATLKSVLPF